MLEHPAPDDICAQAAPSIGAPRAVRCGGAAQANGSQSFEQFAHRFVIMDPFDRFAEQRGHAEHAQVGQLFFGRHGDGIGHDDLRNGGVAQPLHSGSAQDGMRNAHVDLPSTVVPGHSVGSAFDDSLADAHCRLLRTRCDLARGRFAARELSGYRRMDSGLRKTAVRMVPIRRESLDSPPWHRRRPGASPSLRISLCARTPRSVVFDACFCLYFGRFFLELGSRLHAHVDGSHCGRDGGGDRFLLNEDSQLRGLDQRAALDILAHAVVARGYGTASGSDRAT